jgi:hypothetical protein
MDNTVSVLGRQLDVVTSHVPDAYPHAPVTGDSVGIAQCRGLQLYWRTCAARHTIH